jgi:Glyoxalase-like domain
MATVRQVQVTFDCAEPERVARFWCEVLGYVVPPPPEGFATWDDFDRSLPPADRGSWFACIDPSGAGPRLFFQRVPEGKVVKNRVHLDVRVGTGLVGEARLAALEAECARLVALGAVRVRLLPADDDNESCIVMQDIEGNEFDLDLGITYGGSSRREPEPPLRMVRARVPPHSCHASLRRTAKNVTAISTAARTAKTPVSMNWNGQNRYPG